MLRVLILSILVSIFKVNGQDWLCESLICDSPKKCLIVDQVAQCLLETTTSPPPFGTVNGGQPLFPPPSQPSPSSLLPTNVPTLPVAVPTPPHTTSAPTTVPSPFAPFLNLFGGGTPGAPAPTVLPTILPPFTLPTLPTTAPPTTLPPIDICSLPPVTGSCSRARIMWYYDTESRRCERFSWSGCGNENRFSSKMQCEQTCSQNSLFKRNF